MTKSEQEKLQTIALKNNIDWCSLIAQIHGYESHNEDSIWQASKMPDLFPHLITKNTSVSSEKMNGLQALQNGCYIKDSYNCLQLNTAEFRKLFLARWFGWCPQINITQSMASDDCCISKVSSAEAIRNWETSLRGKPVSSPIYVPALLKRNDVFFLTARCEDKVAGISLFMNDQSVGFYNFWGMADLYSEFLAYVRTTFSDKPIVSYDTDEFVQTCIRKQAGAQICGQLSVWQKISEQE